jgi:small subunit ribosomal protein S1
MVKNPDLVFDKAEEMAAKYRENLRKQAAEKEAALVGEEVYEDDEMAVAVD